MNVSSTLVWNIVGWTAAAVAFELIRRRLWKRPLAEVQQWMNRALNKHWRQTPLAVDIPRLARKIAIHLPTQKLERHDEVVPAMELVFTGVASHCCDAQTVEQLRATFLDEAKHYGPNTVDHSRLAADFIDKAFQNHAKALSVLRLCCQDILAPAAIHLKREFDEKASFKDMRGHWHIDIYLDNATEGARVTHAKREQAFSHEEADHFEFLWELTVQLNREYTQIANVTIQITDLKFNEHMSMARKDEIRAVMSNYLIPSLR